MIQFANNKSITETLIVAIFISDFIFRSAGHEEPRET